MLNLAVISLLLIGLWEANLIKEININKLCQILIKLTLYNLIKSGIVKSRRFHRRLRPANGGKDHQNRPPSATDKNMITHTGL